MSDPWVVLGALLLEAGIGYPARLEKITRHPVVWIGKMIASLETLWNTQDATSSRRTLLGIACVGVIAFVAGSVGLGIERIAEDVPFGFVIVMAIATVGLAQRSLYIHVMAVLNPLETGDLATAKHAVSQIVGRDVANLDQSGVARAGLESLAESFCDGIVAPVFWFLIAGLPGLFIYKAVNTADSMIGHLESRWKDFGWAAARTDDVMNLVPARLTGALIVLVARKGWRVMRADAMKHASPNSGWPEAAMAGALNIRLGGSISYDGVVVEKPAFGDGAEPAAADLRRGVDIYVRGCAVMWFGLAAGGLLCRLL